MDSNTHSSSRAERRAALTAAIDELTAQPLDGLTDAALAEELRELQHQRDRLDGQWLRTLAAVDARGPPVPKTASRPARPRPGCGAGCA